MVGYICKVINRSTRDWRIKYWGKKIGRTLGDQCLTKEANNLHGISALVKHVHARKI